MKEIIRLLLLDNGFKLKMFGYQILLILLLIGGYTLSLLLLVSSDFVIAVIGYILAYVTIIFVAAITFDIYVNKLLVKYYPNFIISLGDAIKKTLAAFIIMLINIIILTLIFSIISQIAYGIDFGLVYLSAFIGYIYFLLQLGGVSLGLIYSLLENVDHQKKGFKVVFKTYFKNIVKIRKNCVKISSATIAIVIIMYILYIFLLAIIYSLFGPVLHTPLSFIALILLGWLVLTNYLYIFKKYRQISNEMEV